MHLYPPVARIDVGPFAEDLQRPESVVGDEVEFGVVAHRAVRIQLPSDDDRLAGTLNRSSVGCRRSIAQTLGNPRTAKCKVVPSGSEVGSELRDPLENRFEIFVCELRVTQAGAAAQKQSERR